MQLDKYSNLFANNMSLNKKVFIFTAFLIGVAVLGVFLASRTILIKGYVALEKRQMERNLLRALYAVDNVASEVRILASDWAHWDDAYNFIEDQNEEFIRVNLDDATFKATRLNIIAFADNNGEFVYGKFYDSKEGSELPFPESLKSHINRQDKLISQIGEDYVSGLIKIPEGLMLVSSGPVVKSNGEGPVKGIIIMGRILDQSVSQKVKDITQFPAAILDLADSPFNSDEEGPEFITLEDKGRGKISGFTKIKDIYGSPVAAIRIDMDREVLNEGEKILSYFLLVTFMVGLVAVVGGIFFQERYVLNQIYNLSRGLKRIREKKDLSQRIEITGKDEIARLSEDVNNMLSSLEGFNKATYESEAKLEERLKVIEKQNKDLETTKSAMLNLLEDEKELEETLQKEHGKLDLIFSSMGEGLLVIDRDFKVTAINPKALELFEISAEEIIGKKWSSLAKTFKRESETPLEERSFSRTIRNGATVVTSLEDDHYYKTKSGKTFPIISITAPIKDNGKVVGAVKVFRDASAEKASRKIIEDEVKERTQALWEERARMFASINSLHMGFIIADRKNAIVVKNPAVSEIFRIPESEITMPKIISELRANLDLSPYCQACLSEGKSFSKDEIYYKDKFLRIFITPVALGEKKDIIN